MQQCKSHPAKTMDTGQPPILTSTACYSALRTVYSVRSQTLPRIEKGGLAKTGPSPESGSWSLYGYMKRRGVICGLGCSDFG